MKRGEPYGVGRWQNKKIIKKNWTRWWRRREEKKVSNFVFWHILCWFRLYIRTQQGFLILFSFFFLSSFRAISHEYVSCFTFTSIYIYVDIRTDSNHMIFYNMNTTITKSSSSYLSSSREMHVLKDSYTLFFFSFLVKRHRHVVRGIFLKYKFQPQDYKNECKNKIILLNVN